MYLEAKYEVPVNQLMEGGGLDEMSLLSQLRIGMEDAYQEMYLRYGKRLYRQAVKITRDSCDAEDAVQETLIRAFKNIERFECRSSLYSWLTRILINCCMQQLRKNKRHRALSLDDAKEGGVLWSDVLIDPAIDIEKSAIERDRVAFVKDAIRRLSPDLRFVLTARSELDLPISEIAARKGVSVSAMKSRSARATVEVRRKLVRVVKKHPISKSA